MFCFVYYFSEWITWLNLRRPRQWLINCCNLADWCKPNHITIKLPEKLRGNVDDGDDLADEGGDLHHDVEDIDDISQ